MKQQLAEATVQRRRHPKSLGIGDARAHLASPIDRLAAIHRGCFDIREVIVRNAAELLAKKTAID
jgi:hypothetical protein